MFAYMQIESFKCSFWFRLSLNCRYLLRVAVLVLFSFITLNFTNKNWKYIQKEQKSTHYTECICRFSFDFAWHSWFNHLEDFCSLHFYLIVISFCLCVSRAYYGFYFFFPDLNAYKYIANGDFPCKILQKLTHTRTHTKHF